MQLEIVKDDKLGKPLGTKSGGDVSPTSVESPYSRTSKEDILENLEGIRRIYNGTVGTAPVGGLEQLLMLYSPEVAAALRQQIEASIAAVTAIPGSLSEALVQHRDAVEAAYRELQSLRTLFVGSAMSLLGTDTVFGGSDGD